MKIAMLGAGAMGCIYGQYFSRHNDVLLVDVMQAHVDKINSDGLTFVHLNGETEVFKNMRATTDTTGEEAKDLVVLLTKGYQSAEALQKNSCLIGPDTIVLSLHNGYGNADDIVKYVPESQIVLGTSAGGAIVKGPGYIQHTGQGPTHLGCLTEDQSKAEIVAKLMIEGGVPGVELTPNVKELIWSKVIVNCGINPICAITGMRNHTIVDDKFSNAVSYMLVKEAVAVANATGCNFDFEHEWKNVQDVALATGPNICSMLADVNNKRKTEVDRINGAPVSEGAKVGMKAPLNELIVALIHAKETAYTQQD